jgi:hypothetical protein
MRGEWIHGSGPWFHHAADGMVATVHDGEPEWRGKWQVMRDGQRIAEGKEETVDNAMTVAKNLMNMLV